MPSNQVISTSVAGPVESDGGSIVVVAAGSIGASSGGAVRISCPATGVDNAGSIFGTPVDLNALASPGVVVQTIGRVGVLSNSGSILDASAGILNLGSIGRLVNSGLINSSLPDNSLGLSNAGTIGTLINSGSIFSAGPLTGFGVSNSGAIDAFINSGTVEVSSAGVMNSGTIGQLTNSGTIIGLGPGAGPVLIMASGLGIDNAGSIGVLANDGNIDGARGVRNSGTIDVLTNSGTIEGAALPGLRAGIFSGGAIGQLINGGTIDGNIENAGTIDTLANSGSIRGEGGVIINNGVIRQLVNAGEIGPLPGDTGLGDYGILSRGTIETIINSGTISVGGSSSGSAFGIVNGDFGSSGSDGSIGRLSNSGIISGTAAEPDAAGGGGTGISNNGAISQLENSGIISGTGIGLFTSGTGISNDGTIGQLWNRGTIGGFGTGTTSGTGDGIINNGAIGQLSNSGTISGSGLGTGPAFGSITGAGTGIANAGSITQLSNGGLISGSGSSGGTGIFNGGAIAVLSNTGTIRGSTYALISSGTTIETPSGCGFALFACPVTTAVIGSIANSGTIDGNIEIQHQDLTISGGSGSIFGLLTGGNMTITDGNLVFAGGNQVLGQNITVNGGLGTVTNAGNLMLTAPQRITGNYVQGSGGSLIIGIGASGNGRLDVSGAASMQGATVVARFSAGGDASRAVAGQQFPILTAGGGVTGSLAGVQGDAPASGTRLDAVYTPNMLSLVVTPASYANLSAAGLAGTAGTSAVGSILDAIRPPAGPAMSPAAAAIFNPLYGLEGGQIAPTLQQMTPAIYADALSVNRSTFQMNSMFIDRELEARRGSPAPGGIARGPGDTTVWVGGTGQFFNLNTNAAGAPGYSASSGGLLAGIDRMAWPDLWFGTAIGFSSQNIGATNAATYFGTAVQGQIYASARRGTGFVDMQVGGVFTEGTGRRAVPAYDASPRGSISGSGGGGSLRGGVRIGVGGWTLEPSVLLGGLALSQGGTAETGGAPIALLVAGSSLSSLQSLAGVRVDRRIPVGETSAIVPSVQVGWAYEMLDTAARATARLTDLPGSGFVVSNAPAGRSSLVMGTQATLETATPFQLFASYSVALNSNATAQNVTAGLRFIW